MMMALICGILFALIAQYVRLNTFDKIIATALLKSTEAMQILLFAIGVSSVAFFIEYLCGGAVVEVKPFYVVGVSLGGILFGSGIAILGYCPGTMTMALAEGSIDALFGLVGAVLAGLLYTLAYPSILPFLGPNFGAINLYPDSNLAAAVVVGLYAFLLLFLAFRLGRQGKEKS
jgi:uncharacterized membrane protein YedE/YeeE